MIPDRNQIARAARPQTSACHSTVKVSAVTSKAAAEAYEDMGSLSVSWTVGSTWKRKTAAADMIVSVNADVPGISRKVSKSSF
jgi:hypothetical protein